MIPQMKMKNHEEVFVFAACLAFARLAAFAGCDRNAWENIRISPMNNSLSAACYYYSAVRPERPSNHWRYVDGVPTPW